MNSCAPCARVTLEDYTPPMKYRKLGSSPFCVSCISFGAWQLGDNAFWGDCDGADPDAAVGAAIDAGINLFDTAEVYGRGESEVALGRALGRRRGDVLVASKVAASNCRPQDLRQSCEASLRRLGSEWIDLYQVHWPCKDVRYDDVAATLHTLRDEGKIRAIGVSNFGCRDLDQWPDTASLASNQLAYNLLFRAIEFEIIGACATRELGVIAYMPLMQGLLAGRWANGDDMPANRRRSRHFSSTRPRVLHGEPGCEELTFSTVSQLAELAGELGISVADLSLAAVLAKPFVTSVITGSRRADQVNRNVAAAGIELDRVTLQRIDAITDPLKDELGPNADLWNAGDETRVR